MHHHSSSQQKRQAQAAYGFASVLAANARHGQLYRAGEVADNSSLKPIGGFETPPSNPVGENTSAGRIDSDHFIDTGEMVTVGSGLAEINLSQSVTDCQPVTAELRCDTEIARLSIALRQALCLRPWIVLRELAREDSRKGHTFHQIKRALKRFHVKANERVLQSWLRRGEGSYWNYDPRTKLYYHASPVKVSEYLVTLAHERGLDDLYTTNPPGKRRDMFVNIASDNIAQFEAACYASWHSSKECPTISRILLCKLWNRTEQALWAWERTESARVGILSNYAFASLDHYEALPKSENGELRPDVHQGTINGQPSWVCVTMNRKEARCHSVHIKSSHSSLKL